MRLRPLILAGIAALLAVSIASPFLLRERDESFARIQQAGVLRIGYAIEAPFAMISAEGRVTGESPETARAIAERLRVPRIEWVQAPFEALIPELLDRRLDVIAAGLFITPARAKRVRFSDPTVRVAPAVLVKRGNPKRLKPFQLLRPEQGFRLAVVASSVEESRLRGRGWSSEQLMVVPDGQTGRAAVAHGLADGLVLTEPTVRFIAQSAPQTYELVLDFSEAAAQDVDFVAFAFHPQDVALREAWDRAQAGFIGSEEHLEIIAPFGFDSRDAASDVSAREVLRQ